MTNVRTLFSGLLAHPAEPGLRRRGHFVSSSAFLYSTGAADNHQRWMFIGFAMQMIFLVDIIVKLTSWGLSGHVVICCCDCLITFLVETIRASAPFACEQMFSMIRTSASMYGATGCQAFFSFY